MHALVEPVEWAVRAKTALSSLHPRNDGHHQVLPGAVGVRHLPFPFLGGLALDHRPDHLEISAILELEHFLNGAGPGRYGDGLGLEVVTAASIGHAEQASSAREERATWVQTRRELLKAGWMGAVHGPAPDGREAELSFWQERWERAIESIGQPFVAVLEPPVSGLHGRGAAAAPDAILQALRKLGVLFVTTPDYDIEYKFGEHINFRARPVLSQALNAVNWRACLAKNSVPGLAPCRLLEAALGDEDQLRDVLVSLFNKLLVAPPPGQAIPWLFRRFRGKRRATMPTFPAEVTTSRLDRLEKERAVAIVEQDFGLWSLLGRRRSEDCPRRNIGPALDSHAVVCWRDIAQRFHQDRLLVATPERLLRYVRLRESLVLSESRNTDRWVVTLDGLKDKEGRLIPPNTSDLNGLSLEIPADAPEVSVYAGLSSKPLAMIRRADSRDSRRHVIYMPWSRLQWPNPKAASK